MGKRFKDRRSAHAKNMGQQAPTPPAKAPEVLAKIGILMPSRDIMFTRTAFCLAQMYGFTAMVLTAPGHADIKIYTTSGTYICQSRYTLAKDALADGCTHLFWVDADMDFPEDTLLRLLAHKEPIVAASYVQRVNPHQPVTFKHLMPDGSPHVRLWTEEDSHGLEEVEAIGFGAVLVQAPVFQAIGPTCFDMQYTNANGDHHFIGEDVAFCNAARAAGYKVLIDHDVSKDIGHIGIMSFRHEHGRAVRGMADTLTQEEQQRIYLPGELELDLAARDAAEGRGLDLGQSTMTGESRIVPA
jgi:hypothetical protein